MNAWRQLWLVARREWSQRVRTAAFKVSTVLSVAVVVVLIAGGLLRDPGLPEPVHQFMVTGDPSDFQRLGRRFLGPEIGSAEVAL